MKRTPTDRAVRTLKRQAQQERHADAKRWIACALAATDDPRLNPPPRTAGRRMPSIFAAVAALGMC